MEQSFSQPIGIILSDANTREAKCQLTQSAETGPIREGMFLKIVSGGRNVLAYVTGIIPHNDFYTLGDAWSEARRKQFPIPDEVARQYVVCELDLLGTIPGLYPLSYPPKSGELVYRIDMEKDQKEIFNVKAEEPGYVWYGSLFGYPDAPIPLWIENIPMHLAIFGTTGSGKSHSMGSLIEKLVNIPGNQDRVISMPMLIIDANADYLDYVSYFESGGEFGVCPAVTRYVFPTSPALRQGKRNYRPMAIDINQLSRRELGELIIQYYSGGETAELQVTGIERLLDFMETNQDIPAGDFQQLFLDDNTFRTALVRLNELQKSNLIHQGPAGAIGRALSKFREIERDYQLFSNMNRLSNDFIDNLTRDREIAIIDFSGDGAPGASLELRQVIVSYFALLLFKRFMHYKQVLRRPRHVLFAIEECQNYIPNLTNYNVGASLAREKLSLIATQGRKFGVSLCLISQRPSFVDPVVLSMCNTFFIHRISPEDQYFVEKVSGGLPNHLKKRLTTLEKGTCVVMGQMSKLPFPILINVPPKKIEHTAGTTHVLEDLLKVSEEDDEGL